MNFLSPASANTIGDNNLAYCTPTIEDKTEGANGAPSAIAKDFDEYNRLKQLGRLIEFEKIDPTDSEDVKITKQNMNYNANMSAIWRARRVYQLLSVKYDNSYARDSVITDDALDLQYVKMAILALEKGRAEQDFNFLTYENVLDLATYVDDRRPLIENTEFNTRFEE